MDTEILIDYTIKVEGYELPKNTLRISTQKGFFKELFKTDFYFTAEGDASLLAGIINCWQSGSYSHEMEEYDRLLTFLMANDSATINKVVIYVG